MLWWRLRAGGTRVAVVIGGRRRILEGSIRDREGEIGHLESACDTLRGEYRDLLTRHERAFDVEAAERAAKRLFGELVRGHLAVHFGLRNHRDFEGIRNDVRATAASILEAARDDDTAPSVTAAEDDGEAPRTPLSAEDRRQILQAAQRAFSEIDPAKVLDVAEAPPEGEPVPLSDGGAVSPEAAAKTAALIEATRGD